MEFSYSKCTNVLVWQFNYLKMFSISWLIKSPQCHIFLLSAISYNFLIEYQTYDSTSLGAGYSYKYFWVCPKMQLEVVWSFQFLLLRFFKQDLELRSISPWDVCKTLPWILPKWLLILRFIDRTSPNRYYSWPWVSIWHCFLLFLGWFFFWPWVVSLHTCANQYSAKCWQPSV